MLHVYVDADGCPVKDEVYRVAARCELHVSVVANARIRVPSDPRVTLVVVGSAFDAADDWIAQRCGVDDIVITADIPLAARCLQNGARVLGHRGDLFTEDSIGDALASRDIATYLRDIGEPTRGPAPFTPRHRSSFLQRLDDVVQAIRRAQRDGGR